MASSEGIKEIVNQAAVQRAAAVMMAFSDTETGSKLAMILTSETHRQRHGGHVIEMPNFNWDMQDRYIKLLNFKLEVTNILETRAYKRSEEKNPSY